MAKWIGYAVSVNCGEPLGCYQGTILEADGNTLTLTKAFRNGFPYPKSQVTLNAADIKDLQIIESKAEPAGQTHSTVAVTKSNKKCQKATVCENLQANPTNPGTSNQSNVIAGSSGSKGSNSRGPGPGSGPTRSKPIDIQGNRSKNNTHAGSYGNPGSTPKARGAGAGAGAEKARRRNEACFGDAAEIAPDDFDFEGNLALFDKRALWESMRGAPKPDVVRQADAALRHDENVLAGAAPPAAWGVPEHLRAPQQYVTDDGARVWAVRREVRRALLDGLERLGLGECSRSLVARAAADVCARLLGGGRRLEPRNAHQAPVVAALLAPHAAGAVGARTLRLLRALGARVHLHLSEGGAGAGAGAGAPHAALQHELAALALDDVRPAALERLPDPDLVVVALHDPQAEADAEAEAAEAAAHGAALRWALAARGGRALRVAVEPPEGAWAALGLSWRAGVAGGVAPAAGGAGGAGGMARLYVAQLAAPARLLRLLGLPAPPTPHDHALALALHPLPDDDDRL